MPSSTAPPKKSKKKTPGQKIGRPGMFTDPGAVARVLKGHADMRKKQGLSSYLADLIEVAKNNFPDDVKGRKEGAIRQAVYRLVCKYKIWLSRSQGAK